MKTFFFFNIEEDEFYSKTSVSDKREYEYIWILFKNTIYVNIAKRNTLKIVSLSPRSETKKKNILLNKMNQTQFLIKSTFKNRLLKILQINTHPLTLCPGTWCDDSCAQLPSFIRWQAAVARPRAPAVEPVCRYFTGEK